MSITNLHFACAEDFEEVKRPWGFNPKGTSVTIGKVKNIHGLKLRKIVNVENELTSEKIEARGYQIEGEKPFIDLVVKEAQDAEIVVCDLEMIDKRLNQKSLIENNDKGVEIEKCNNGPVDNGMGTISVPNLKKISRPLITNKDVDFNNFNQGQILCIKKQIEAIKESQFFKSYYGNRKLLFVALDNSKLKNQEFDFKRQFFVDAKRSAKLRSAGYSGAISVAIGKMWSCKFDSAKKIDEEILKNVNSKLKESINHLGTEEKKSTIAKMREDEARMNKEPQEVRTISSEEKEKQQGK